MFLVSAATATFPHRYSQDEICDWVVGRAVSPKNQAWIREVFKNTRVDYRSFVLPIEEIARPRDFGERNALFAEHAPRLLKSVIDRALQQAGVGANAVGALVTATSSGFLTPSLDAHLLNDCHLPASCLRLPVVGLGCAAGVSVLAHAMRWATGTGREVVVLANIELNSLTYRLNDSTKVNFIGAALFADGASAVVCRSDVRGGWKFVDAASFTLPKSQDLMGWDMAADGYGLILSEDVPEAVAEMAVEPLKRFLESNDLKQEDVGRWIIHPGGPKILAALSETTGLTGEPIERSLRGLAQHGNMSACSIMYALADMLTEPAHAGQTCCLLAFGPGFSMEMLLLKYQG